MIISDEKKRIGYISYYCVGKKHDYHFLKEEFPPEQPWFKDFHVKVDLGYLGMATDYVYKILDIPHKRKPKSQLTALQEKENKAMASKRITVEHSIRGIKRYRILSDRLRTHDLDLYNNVLGVCAGLWNFYLDN